MSEATTEETTTTTEPYSLGEVNMDSLKECLLFLSQSYPFVDEVAKEAFTAQANSLDKAGSPHIEGSTTIPTIATETPAETPATESGEPAGMQTPTEETAEATATATPTAEEIAAAQAVIDAANNAAATEGAVTIGSGTANEPAAAETTTNAEGS